METLILRRKMTAKHAKVEVCLTFFLESRPKEIVYFSFAQDDYNAVKGCVKIGRLQRKLDSYRYSIFRFSLSFMVCFPSGFVKPNKIKEQKPYEKGHKSFLNKTSLTGADI